MTKFETKVSTAERHAIRRPLGLPCICFVIRAWSFVIDSSFEFRHSNFVENAMQDLSRLAIHTQTNKPWTLRQCVEAYSAAGIPGISVWRHVIEPLGSKEAGKIIRDYGLKVPALVRGGFFTALDPAARLAALDMNRACIDEAREIGAEMVVLVVGATPGLSLQDARKQVTERIAALIPYAKQANVKLTIEPLHPMYAGDKSCINRMAEAREVCQALREEILGIAVDVYHLWWDPDLESEIKLAGQLGLIFAFHVCDWLANTTHMLTDRGLMGEGVINIPQIRSWVEAAGFNGMIEVEIFSERLWATYQTAYVKQIAEAYLQHV
jgi:sugar phosphate isomerase/epimerase